MTGGGRKNRMCSLPDNAIDSFHVFRGIEAHYGLDTHDLSSVTNAGRNLNHVSRREHSFSALPGNAQTPSDYRILFIYGMVMQREEGSRRVMIFRDSVAFSAQ